MDQFVSSPYMEKGLSLEILVSDDFDCAGQNVAPEGHSWEWETSLYVYIVPTIFNFSAIIDVMVVGEVSKEMMETMFCRGKKIRL